MPAILICDDQPDVLIALQLLLKAAGYEAQTADSPHRLLEQLAARRCDLVLTDMNFSRDTTSGREGLDLVEQIRRRAQAPPVVVMTAWGDIDLAVQAMRRGAADFVTKPCCSTLPPPRSITTLFYGVYDAETRQVRYASAGHVPATLIRQDGTEESHGSTGTVLGLFSKVTMGESSLTCSPNK